MRIRVKTFGVRQALDKHRVLVGRRKLASPYGRSKLIGFGRPFDGGTLGSNILLVTAENGEIVEVTEIRKPHPWKAFKVGSTPCQSDC